MRSHIHTHTFISLILNLRTSQRSHSRTHLYSAIYHRRCNAHVIYPFLLWFVRFYNIPKHLFSLHCIFAIWHTLLICHVSPYQVKLSVPLNLTAPKPVYVELLAQAVDFGVAYVWLSPSYVMYIYTHTVKHTHAHILRISDRNYINFYKLKYLHYLLYSPNMFCVDLPRKIA